MPAEIIKSTIDSILRDFSLCSHELGGLEFYGYSAEFRDLLSLCRDFATDVEPGTQTSRKAYVFLDNAHGKTSLSRAIAIHRETGGGKAFRFDGTVGSTSKDVKDLQHNTDALVVIDDLPEASDPRSKLLERLNSLTGRAIVFARPEYATDAHLRPDTPCLKLDHVDYRQIDKIAWLIGLVREQLRDEGGFLSPVLAAALANLPAGLLSTLSSVRLGLKIANLPLLAVRIAEAVRINVVLQDGRSIQENELAAIFADFCSSGSDPMDTRFRLWVEGESDSRILKLACQLARPIHGLDLEEGLAIIPLGLGRDGGTSIAFHQNIS